MAGITPDERAELLLKVDKHLGAVKMYTHAVLVKDSLPGKTREQLVATAEEALRQTLLDLVTTNVSIAANILSRALAERAEKG